MTNSIRLTYAARMKQHEGMTDDHYEKFYGYVHNIGAGGTNVYGGMNYIQCSYKRRQQFYMRTNRAIGLM